MLWSEKSLFILCEVNDNYKYDRNLLKYKIVDAPEPWDCDAIELFFDSKNLKENSFNPSNGNYKYEP